jgi:hypothetical protein
MPKSTTRVGDVYQIPLSDGRSAYGQYVYFDKRYGPLIQIYDYFTKGQKNIDLDQITNSPALFPPVITGINSNIRDGDWKIIGNKQVANFVYPGFISTLEDPRTRQATTWYFWDGIKSERLGTGLPQKYKSLEFLAVYPGKMVESRIISGEKPYKKLIETNRS